MSKAVEILQAALEHGMRVRHKVGGFPYLAEALRQAGVIRNVWQLPACQSLYVMEAGEVMMTGALLVSGAVDVPQFDRDALIHALRTDQAGQSTFPEFLASSWRAGVVSYEVDFQERVVVYRGARGEEYAEHYPAVSL